jgi:hypothetical protein
VKVPVPLPGFIEGTAITGGATIAAGAFDATGCFVVKIIGATVVALEGVGDGENNSSPFFDFFFFFDFFPFLLFPLFSFLPFLLFRLWKWSWCKRIAWCSCRAICRHVIVIVIICIFWFLFTFFAHFQISPAFYLVVHV